jgi:hypothetical protein
MPISVSVSSIDWVRHIAFTGIISDNDILAAYNVIAQCLLDPSMDVLVDTAGVESVAVTDVGLRTLAARRARDAHGGDVVLPRVAVIAPSTRVFDIARTYQSTPDCAAQCSRFMVCQTLEQARALLGLTHVAEPLSLAARA